MEYYYQYTGPCSTQPIAFQCICDGIFIIKIFIVRLICMYSCPLLWKRKFSRFQIEVLKEKYLLKLLGLLWPSTTWLIMNFLFSFQFPCCVINVRQVERIQIRVVHFSINFSDMSLLHVAFFRPCAAHPSYDECTTSTTSRLKKYQKQKHTEQAKTVLATDNFRSRDDGPRKIAKLKETECCVLFL